MNLFGIVSNGSTKVMNHTTEVSIRALSAGLNIVLDTEQKIAEIEL